MAFRLSVASSFRSRQTRSTTLRTTEVDIRANYFPKMAVRSENHFGEANLNIFWNCRIPRSDIVDFCSVHFRFFIFSPWFCLGRCWAEWAVVGVRPQRRALGCGKAWGWGQNHQVTVLTLSSHGFVIPKSKFFKLSFSVKWNIRKLHDS